MERRHLLIGAGGLALATVGGIALTFRAMGSSAGYDDAMAMIRAPLPDRPQLPDLVRYATLAANGHNTQPWRFRLSENRIDILPDFARRTPVVDPDDHHVYASLGCATANLALAADAAGRRADVAFQSAGDGIVSVALGNGTPLSSPLLRAIPLRQSTRSLFDGRPVSVNDLPMLAAAAKVPGVDTVLVTDRLQMDRIRDLVIAGNSAQMADAAWVAELKQWLRYNPAQAITTGDGLYAGSSGNPLLPTWLGSRLIDVVFQAKAENDRYAKHIASSSGIAVFVAEKDDREHWFKAGQACQRFALQATALGLKHAFINQPGEVSDLRPQLAAMVGLPGRRPNIIMRFGYGPSLPMSPRRPVTAILV